MRPSRLAWELAESAGCAEEIAMDRKVTCRLVSTAEEKCSPVTAFLVGLTGDAPLTVSPRQSDRPADRWQCAGGMATAG